MKREIKFRAFYKNKIRDVVSIDWRNEFCSLAKGFVEIPLKDINLMQYTGLKDVRGVEIYEGDIVRVNYSGNDDFSGLALVVFRNGCFELEGKIMEIINSEGIMYDDFYAISNDLSRYSACVKAIGNKFKNPELLEASE